MQPAQRTTTVTVWARSSCPDKKKNLSFLHLKSEQLAQQLSFFSIIYWSHFVICGPNINFHRTKISEIKQRNKRKSQCLLYFGWLICASVDCGDNIWESFAYLLKKWWLEIQDAIELFSRNDLRRNITYLNARPN